MAVPADFTILDISGKFTMNKELSGESDTILMLQGVSWFKRKAIQFGTVTLFIKHYKDDNGEEHIDIDQAGGYGEFRLTITGGMAGTREERHLTWKDREHHDTLFGHVIGKSRRIQVADLDEEYLRNGWTPDTIEYGVVQSYVESDTPKSGTSWIGNQTWGVQQVNGERRYARNVKFTGPQGEDVERLLVYDY
ncbi:hypothetical protein C8F01DRAFT_1014146, partial [Mycena amicta]